MEDSHELNIFYKQRCSDKRIRYSDAGDTSDNKSTSGYIFHVKWCTSLIVQQKPEAHYVGLSGAALECLWLRQL